MNRSFSFIDENVAPKDIKRRRYCSLGIITILATCVFEVLYWNKPSAIEIHDNLVAILTATIILMIFTFGCQSYYHFFFLILSYCNVYLSYRGLKEIGDSQGLHYYFLSILLVYSMIAVHESFRIGFFFWSRRNFNKENTTTELENEEVRKRIEERAMMYQKDFN